MKGKWTLLLLGILGLTLLLFGGGLFPEETVEAIIKEVLSR